MSNEIRHLARVDLPQFRMCLERLIERVRRPVMLGEIVVEVAYTINYVESEMIKLCEAGIYRQLTENEVRERGWDYRVIAYAPLWRKI